MITKNGEPIRNENGDIDFLDTLTEAEKETIKNEAIFKAGGVLAEIDKAEQLIGKVADQSGFLETIQGVLLGSTGFGCIGGGKIPFIFFTPIASYIDLYA